MALNWGLLVVLFALNVGFSEAINATNTTVAATTPTTSFVATTIQNAPAAISTTAVASPTAAATTSATNTVVPTSPTAGPSGFYTYLIASFKSSECTAEKADVLNSKFKGFYNDAVFDVMNSTFGVKRDECQFNFTFAFGPNLREYKISEVFMKGLISRSGYTVDSMELTDLQTKLYVPSPGFTLGHFKVRADGCKICFDGAGGPINLYRNCTPPKTSGCEKFELKMEVRDCLNVCLKESSGVMCVISLLVLFFGVFMNWFLK